MTLKQIELEISKLDKSQFWRLAEWFGKYHDTKWDEEFENDVKASKLNALGAEAMADLKHGRVTKL